MCSFDWLFGPDTEDTMIEDDGSLWRIMVFDDDEEEDENE